MIIFLEKRYYCKIRTFFYVNLLETGFFLFLVCACMWLCVSMYLYACMFVCGGSTVRWAHVRMVMLLVCTDCCRRWGARGRGAAAGWRRRRCRGGRRWTWGAPRSGPSLWPAHMPRRRSRRAAALHTTQHKITLVCAACERRWCSAGKALTLERQQKSNVWNGERGKAGPACPVQT